MIDISNSESIIRVLLTDRLLIDHKMMIQINGGNRPLLGTYSLYTLKGM